MKDEPPKSPPPEPRKRMGWLRRDGIDLGDAAVQFIAVLLGVLLALLINRWNDQRMQQAKAQAAQRQQQVEVHEATHAIRAELIANRTSLHRNAAYWHKHVLHVIDASKNLTSAAPRHCYLLPGWTSNHTEVAPVTDAAYQTAIATHAMAHMPFQLAHRVARIYGFQKQQHKVQTFILRHFIFSGQRTLDICVGMMESFEKNNYLLSKTYTPLIGPDHTKWPTPPPIPRNTSTLSK